MLNVLFSYMVAPDGLSIAIVICFCIVVAVTLCRFFSIQFSKKDLLFIMLLSFISTILSLLYHFRNDFSNEYGYPHAFSIVGIDQPSLLSLYPWNWDWTYGLLNLFFYITLFLFILAVIKVFTRNSLENATKRLSKTKKMIINAVIVFFSIVLFTGLYIMSRDLGASLDDQQFIKELQQSEITKQSTNRHSSIQQVTPVNRSVQDTQGWKTYTNNVFNFSFQYSPDWVLKENTTGTLESKGIQIILTDVLGDTTIFAYNGADYGGGTYLVTYTKISPISIDSHKYYEHYLYGLKSACILPTTNPLCKTQFTDIIVYPTMNQPHDVFPAIYINNKRLDITFSLPHKRSLDINSPTALHYEALFDKFLQSIHLPKI